MDISRFRRSENVELPTEVADPLRALLFDPKDRPWSSTSGPTLGSPQTAAEFPTMLPATEQDMQSPVAQQLGIQDLVRMMAGEPDYAARAREAISRWAVPPSPAFPPPSGSLKDY